MMNKFIIILLVTFSFNAYAVDGRGNVCGGLPAGC